ncbi:serpentine type 7TM GPCR chemoreceptor srd domain-containing protein [Ditylenchus destructor]|nr:serpentine type 7TM GPCR chemoreceptor srd domain-containing protein [Ditylenchus destructor]
MVSISRIHHVMETMIGVCSLTANLTLLLLILTKSQFRVKAYKRILLVTCLVDLFYTIIVFVGQPTILADHGYHYCQVNGFFSNRWAMFDYVCCGLYCTSIHSNCVCVITMFIYRYHTVCGQNGQGKIRHMWFVFVLAVFWCMLQSADAFWVYCEGQNPELRKLGLEILDRYGWEYDPQHPPFPTMSYATDAKNILHHSFYMTTLVVGYTIIIWCQSKIMEFLNQHGKSSHASTQRMHAEAITPSISLIMPVFVVVLALAMSATLGPMAAFLSMCMSAITLANPVTVIYFVKPYRRAVVGFLTCGKYHGGASVESSQKSGGQTRVGTTNSVTNPDLSEVA